MSGPSRRYRLLRRIETGGAADLREAVSIGPHGFERRVVVKTLHAERAAENDLLSAFVDEARIAAQLHHGNIVSVLDFGVMDGIPFQVLELVDGVDAFELARRAREQNEGVPPAIALAIMTEVAHALAYAHEARDAMGTPLGIVHRDVSPENILVSRAGDVKLADFGIALAHRRSIKTVAGYAKGKLSYMAPEQAMALPLDARADLFAAGCVLHFLLTGRSPVSTDAARAAVVAGEECTLSPELDADIARVIRRATRTSPLDRFERASDLAGAIGGLMMRRLDRDPRTALRDWVARILPATSPSSHAPLEPVELVLEDSAETGVTRAFRTSPSPSTSEPGTIAEAPTRATVLAAAESSAPEEAEVTDEDVWDNAGDDATRGDGPTSAATPHGRDASAATPHGRDASAATPHGRDASAVARIGSASSSARSILVDEAGAGPRPLRLALFSLGLVLGSALVAGLLWRAFERPVQVTLLTTRPATPPVATPRSPIEAEPTAVDLQTEVVPDPPPHEDADDPQAATPRETAPQEPVPNEVTSARDATPSQEAAAQREASPRDAAPRGGSAQREVASSREARPAPVRGPGQSASGALDAARDALLAAARARGLARADLAFLPEIDAPLRAAERASTEEAKRAAIAPLEHAKSMLPNLTVEAPLLEQKLKRTADLLASAAGHLDRATLDALENRYLDQRAAASRKPEASGRDAIARALGALQMQLEAAITRR